MVNKKSKPTKAVGTQTQTNTTVKAPVIETPIVETPVQKAPVKKVINPFGRKVSNRPVTYTLISKKKNKKGQVQYPIVYMLRAEDIIFDSEKNQQRQIRYIPGQLSIFADEQDEKAVVKAPITFNNGFLMVDKTNPNLRKFLDMCNANADNLNRRASSAPAFRKLDHEKNAKQNLKKSMKVLDAITTAIKMPLDQMVGYAKVLGVRTNKSTDEIRYDMKVLAEKDPEGFLKGLDDPKVEVKQILIRAQEANLISLGKSVVTWIKGDLRPIIRHVPLGVTPLDCLSEFCLTQDGDVVLQQIKIQLNINS